MSSGAGKPGQALAAAGGAGLALSLWLPWYSIHFPAAAINSVVQMSQQLGALGPLMRTGAQLINQLGPFHVTAWQAFSTTPAVLLTAAIIGGGLAMMALADRAGSTSQLTILAGAVAALLVGYRIAVPPTQSGFVHPAWAIYLALISSLAMVAGGALAGRESPSPAEPTLITPRPDPYPPGPAASAWPPAEPVAAMGSSMSLATEPGPAFAGPTPVFGGPAESPSSPHSVPPPGL